jgi:hypothetical protein
LVERIFLGPKEFKLACPSPKYEKN